MRNGCPNNRKRRGQNNGGEEIEEKSSFVSWFNKKTVNRVLSKS